MAEIGRFYTRTTWMGDGNFLLERDKLFALYVYASSATRTKGLNYILSGPAHSHKKTKRRDMSASLRSLCPV